MPTAPAPLPPEKTQPNGKPSPIDAHVELLGKRPDKDIAALAGVSTSAVTKFRGRRKIAAFQSKAPRAAPKRGPRTKRSSPSAKPSAPSPKPSTNAKASAAAKGRKRGRKSASGVLDSLRSLIGVRSDGEVAEKAGVSDETVRKYRIDHGIPSARERARTQLGAKSSAKPPKASKPTTPPKSAAKAPAPATVGRPKASAARTSACWKVSATGRDATYVIADTLAQAASRAQGAFGDGSVVAIERVGPGLA